MLGRIEGLEARERERKEPLAEIMEMGEEHGLDTEALKVVMGS